MKQIERIKIMEEYLDEINPIIEQLNELLDKYLLLDSKYHKLEKYYHSKNWLKDYEDDEKGKFPQDLKRGILSEDTIYDLLIAHDEMLKKMNKLLIKNKNGGH